MSEKSVIRAAIPVIPVQKFDETIAFYEEKLGFKKAFSDGGYAGIRRDGAEIHIYQHDDRALAEQTMLRVSVAHIEGLCAEFNANGLACEVKVQSWGTKDLPVIDPAGNCLTFFEDVE